MVRAPAAVSQVAIQRPSMFRVLWSTPLGTSTCALLELLVSSSRHNGSCIHGMVVKLGITCCSPFSVVTNCGCIRVCFWRHCPVLIIRQHINVRVEHCSSRVMTSCTLCCWARLSFSVLVIVVSGFTLMKGYLVQRAECLTEFQAHVEVPHRLQWSRWTFFVLLANRSALSLPSRISSPSFLWTFFSRDFGDSDRGRDRPRETFSALALPVPPAGGGAGGEPAGRPDKSGVPGNAGEVSGGPRNHQDHQRKQILMVMESWRHLLFFKLGCNQSKVTSRVFLPKHNHCPHTRDRCGAEKVELRHRTYPHVNWSRTGFQEEPPSSGVIAGPQRCQKRHRGCPEATCSTGSAHSAKRDFDGLPCTEKNSFASGAGFS